MIFTHFTSFTATSFFFFPLTCNDCRVCDARPYFRANRELLNVQFWLIRRAGLDRFERNIWLESLTVAPRVSSSEGLPLWHLVEDDSAWN